MLIVTGASGQLGRNIVHHLLLHVPAERIGVSVRNPDSVTDLSDLGVRVRQGDFEDADSLHHAWEGAERLLLVSSNAAASGGDPLKQHATALRIARELKVARVLYTSQVSSSENSYFPPGRHHAATETMLSESGLAWTALRHGFYAASGLQMNHHSIETGALVAPQDGKVAWTTHDDLAAADAALLAGVEVIDGPTPPLTSQQTLDFADLAQQASAILGKPISRTIVSEDVMIRNAQEAGVPRGSIEFMLSYFRAARAGEFAAVDPTLGRLIGHEPETMESYMKRMLGKAEG